MADTGVAEDRTADTVGEDTDETDQSSGEDDPANAPDSGRLLERGVKLHALSADEGDCTDEEMEERDLTPEEAAAATAVLDAPDENDQEGLALTGGDWFNTIKQVEKNNKEAEKGCTDKTYRYETYRSETYRYITYRSETYRLLNLSKFYLSLY